MDQLLEFFQGVHPILLNSFTFLAGVLIGHWIQLGRDKRQEYNEIVKPLRATLVEFAEHPTPYLYCDPVQLDQLRHYLWWGKRTRLERAMRRLEECSTKQLDQDAAGQPNLTNRPIVSACTRELLQLIPLR